MMSPFTGVVGALGISGSIDILDRMSSVYLALHDETNLADRMVDRGVYLAFWTKEGIQRETEIRTDVKRSELFHRWVVGEAWLNQTEPITQSTDLKDRNPLSAEAPSGHFLIFTYRPEKQEFSIFVDPVGTINLYYAFCGDLLLISTSSLTLAACLPQVTLDEIGCLEFLAVGYPLGDRTFYKEIKVLLPASHWCLSLMNIKRGIYKIWWTPPMEQERQQIDPSPLAKSMIQVCQKIATRYPQPLCDFTGGYDSRGVVASFLRSGLDFATVVNGIPSDSDVATATKIATKFGWPHDINNLKKLEENVSPSFLRKILGLTDGEIDFSEYVLTALIHQKAAQRDTVTVNGSGGELCRGYWWEGESPYEGRRERVNIEYLLHRILLPNYLWSIHPVGIKESLYSVLRKEIEHYLEEISPALNTRKIDYVYLKLRMGRWYARYYSSTMQILPCFSPFLMQPMLDIAFALPPLLKKHNRFYCYWLTHLHPDLAKAPLNDGSPAVPLTIGNIWRFLPRLVFKSKFYSCKAWDRAAVHLFPKLLKKTCVTATANRILSLADQEENLTDLLDSVQMESGQLYNRKVLFALVDRSRRSSFSSGSFQLSRIYTLEQAWQTVTSLRSKFSPS